MLKIDRIVIHLPAGTEHQAVFSARALAEQLGRSQRAGTLRPDSKPRLAVNLTQSAGEPLPSLLATGVAQKLERRGGG